jgi:hypothetical protein
MPIYDVRIKKTNVSYYWVTVSARDSANAEVKAIASAPQQAREGNFDSPEAPKFTVTELCKADDDDASDD